MDGVFVMYLNMSILIENWWEWWELPNEIVEFYTQKNETLKDLFSAIIVKTKTWQAYGALRWEQKILWIFLIFFILFYWKYWL